MEQLETYQDMAVHLNLPFNVRKHEANVRKW